MIKDIPGFLSTLDLFALTSHNEAKPVSILEAMSCIRPVVATNVGSVSESVIDGVTGFLVAEGDQPSMSRKWIEILSDPTLRQELGNAGRDHVKQNSSIESMTEGYTSLIEQLYEVKRPTSFADSTGTLVSWTWYNNSDPSSHVDQQS